MTGFRRGRPDIGDGGKPPLLQLLFNNPGGALPAGITVTRATSKVTNLGSTALTVGSNVGSIESAGLTIEAAHTNLLKGSVGVNNGWNNDASGTANTGTANDTTAPDGTLTGTKITFNTASNTGWSFWEQAITGSAAGNNTLSLWMKAGTTSSVGLVLLETSGSFTAQQVSLTSDWQRFTLTRTATVDINQVRIGGQAFYGGTTVALGTIYIWGVQVEAGAYARSYVPTTSASATCNGDAVAVDSTAVLPIASGSMSVEYTPLWSVIPATLVPLATFTSSAAGHAGIEIYITPKLSFFTLKSDATNTNLQSATLSWIAGQRYAIHAAWGAGNLYLYRDNVLVASITDGSAVMPNGHDNLTIGSAIISGSPADFIDGHINRVAFFSH